MKIGLPKGVQDYVGAECYNKMQIEKAIIKNCVRYGYERIEPAALEYYDNFCGEHGSMSASRMFKTTDLDGEILVLRPDATLQVSRIAAERFADDECKRFYYVTDSFALKTEQTEYDRECAQFGVELIGSDAVGSDVEIVHLAIRSCLEIGLQDFQIELGHIDFFYGLIEGLGLDAEEKERLRVLVNRKDMIGVNALLKNKNAPREKLDRINLLPYLFGGPEVLSRARKLADNAKSRAALDRLDRIIDLLKERGIDGYITIDLGMVKTNNYYSGIVLRGISKVLGYAVLDGGRYDILSHNHGFHRPSVGFTIWIKRLLILLEKQGLFRAPAPADAGIWVDEHSEAVGYRYAEMLRGNGEIVVRMFGTAEEAERRCAAQGIGRLIIVRQGKVREKEIADV